MPKPRARSGSAPTPKSRAGARNKPDDEAGHPYVGDCHVRQKPGVDHPRGDEAARFGGGIFDAFDFEADAGKGFDDLGEGRRGVEMVFQPGEGEFHQGRFLNRSDTARLLRSPCDSVAIE